MRLKIQKSEDCIPINIIFYGDRIEESKMDMHESDKEVPYCVRSGTKIEACRTLGDLATFKKPDLFLPRKD